MKLHGILITKDDDYIIGEWLKKHSPFFDTIAVVDGSISGTDFTRDLCKDYSNVIYNTDPVGIITDQTLRKCGWDSLSKEVSIGDWIFMCHPDEFLFHNPRKFMEIDEVIIRWIALHILPHPSEKESWIKSKDKNPVKLFKHYWWKRGDKVTYEYRMWRYVKEPSWDISTDKFGLPVLPINFTNESEHPIHPIHKHYKIYDLNINNYGGDEYVRKDQVVLHGRTIKSSLGTHIGGRVINEFDDFFFDEKRPWGHKGFVNFSNDESISKFNNLSDDFLL